MSTYVYTSHESAALTADLALFAPDTSSRTGLLLVQRRYDPDAGRWALPGGHLDPGETDQAAAARECREETGVTPDELVYVGAYRAPGRDARGRVVSFAWCAWLDTPVEPAAADDAEAAAWWPVDALPEPLAFDHGEIVADALAVVQSTAGTDIAATSPADRELYRERAHLVAVLTAHYPARLACNDHTEPGLSVLYLHTPAGQVSYHVAPDDLDLFEHVPYADGDRSVFAVWDGHSKAEALDRLRTLAAPNLSA